jgi:hypothetical protein
MIYDASRIDSQLANVVEETPTSLERDERLTICPILPARSLMKFSN